MSDIVDRANKTQALLLGSQIADACSHEAANSTTICIDCGGGIGTRRKQAVPWAVRCVTCQNDFEKRGR